MNMIAFADVHLIVAAIVPILVAIVFLVVFASTFSQWLRAFLAGVPVPVVVIIGMRPRKTPVDVVLRHLIMAGQGKVDVSCAEMERAYLQDVDLEKVTLAAIHAARQGMDIPFKDLVTAEMEDRLKELLGM